MNRVTAPDVDGTMTRSLDVDMPAPHHPGSAPKAPAPLAAASSSAAGSAGGGSFSPTFFAVLLAAFLAFAQATRALRDVPASFRSVTRILLVERPG